MSWEKILKIKPELIPFKSCRKHLSLVVQQRSVASFSAWSAKLQEVKRHILWLNEIFSSGIHEWCTQNHVDNVESWKNFFFADLFSFFRAFVGAGGWKIAYSRVSQVCSGSAEFLCFIKITRKEFVLPPISNSNQIKLIKSTEKWENWIKSPLRGIRFDDLQWFLIFTVWSCRVHWKEWEKQWEKGAMTCEIDDLVVKEICFTVAETMIKNYFLTDD